MEKRFNVVIVGSGPGGYKVAKFLLEKKLRVCLVEKSLFGGTCLNAGCIPKDYLYNIAVSSLRLKQTFGKIFPLDWEKAIMKIQEKISVLRKNAEEFLKRKGLEIVYGEGELVDEKIIKVENLKLIGDYIVLACGSKPKEEGIHPEDILTGKTFPKKKVLVKGEGPSACELAFILKVFGFEVSILVKDRLLSSLPQIPESFSAKLETAFEELGIEVVEEEIVADTVIVATGREPNLCSELFPFIKKHPSGFVEVDEYLETNVPGVYAVGDIVPPMGASFAFEKARVVAYNIVNGKSLTFEPSKVPVVITSAYEIGFIGDPSRIVRTEHLSMSLNPKSFVNHKSGILRIGYNEEDKPVFLCGIGHGISEIMNVFSSYMEGSFSHPSYAELIEEVFKQTYVKGS